MLSATKTMYYNSHISDSLRPTIGGLPISIDSILHHHFDRWMASPFFTFNNGQLASGFQLKVSRTGTHCMPARTPDTRFCNWSECCWFVQLLQPVSDEAWWFVTLYSLSFSLLLSFFFNRKPFCRSHPIGSAPERLPLCCRQNKNFSDPSWSYSIHSQHNRHKT